MFKHFLIEIIRGTSWRYHWRHQWWTLLSSTSKSSSFADCNRTSKSEIAK